MIIARISFVLILRFYKVELMAIFAPKALAAHLSVLILNPN